MENSKNDGFEGASPLTGFEIIACRPFYAVDVLGCRWANQYFSSLLTLPSRAHALHTAVTRSSACALGRVAVAGFASVGWLGFRCFLALALMHRAQVALFYVAQCLTLRSSGPAFCGPLTLAVSNK